jgi:hypothetical protein
MPDSETVAMERRMSRSDAFNSSAWQRREGSRAWWSESRSTQVGRDLLEQHVGADLEAAAARLNGGKPVISAFMTTSPTKASAAMRETSVGIGSPSFMPIGVALTTMS